ncbi:ABC transporter permease [Leptolyngbya sp. 'hensonii']|uniref:ABC transporter permease n=1 Tax=Leptolyngbya sp. 'hensonii' TaxID=1922337 RepID=UPI00094FBA7A|nr:ABC transporter permease [Leptolyngbya sp. 'hensonii']OLP16722.1 ABC transporter permease [Leptolyngbya sp. 'hensonii']
MNPVRILTIASHVFREVIRDRVLYLVAFYGFLLVVAIRLLPEVSAGAENKILLDLGLGVIGLLGLIVSIFVGTSLISKEIEKRTVYILLAKPITQIELIVGKHLGLSAVLAVLLGLMTAIYMGILSWSQIPYPMGSILITVLYNLLELSLLAAVALVFSVFTGPLLATLISFAVYLIGHFSRDLVALGNLSDKAEIQRLTRSIYLLLPDLSRLDFKNEAVYGILPDPSTMAMNAGYALLYVVLLLSVATLIFSYREF